MENSLLDVFFEIILLEIDIPCPLFLQQRQSLFRVLDEDGSGDIAYTEFVEQVVKMSSLPSNLTMRCFSPGWVVMLRNQLSLWLSLLVCFSFGLLAVCYCWW